MHIYMHIYAYIYAKRCNRPHSSKESYVDTPQICGALHIQRTRFTAATATTATHTAPHCNTTQ